MHFTGENEDPITYFSLVPELEPVESYPDSALGHVRVQIG